MTRRHDIGLPSRQSGSAVMIVLLVMITGSAAFLLTQLNKGDAQQPRSIDTRNELNAIMQALIGYAQSNGGCLPCPTATATNGVAAATCAAPAAARAGFLPWRTLSLGDADRWGNRYRYVVDPEYTDVCGFALPGALISVSTRNNAGAPVVVANNLVAVVISHGVNGLGARTTTGAALPNPPAANSDEQANRTGTVAFWQRAANYNQAVVGGPFDDQIAYISRQTLATEYAMTP